MAVVTGDRRRAGVLIGAHNAAQFLGVELTRQCRRTHHVAKQHGHLTAFGLGLRWVFRIRTHRQSATIQSGDRLEEAHPVADAGDADILERVLGEVGQDTRVDVVIGEGLTMSAETEALKPC